MLSLFGLWFFFCFFCYCVVVFPLTEDIVVAVVVVIIVGPRKLTLNFGQIGSAAA